MALEFSKGKGSAIVGRDEGGSNNAAAQGKARQGRILIRDLGEVHGSEGR